MKSYWILFIPAAVFFALPIINILYQSAKANAAARAKEEQRRRAAEIKQAKQAARQAAKERATETKRAEKGNGSAGSAPKRKPGRPRKNPSMQRPETILKKQEPEKPAPLPTSCTLDQFAAWIG